MILINNPGKHVETVESCNKEEEVTKKPDFRIRYVEGLLLLLLQYLHFLSFQ